MRDHFDNVAQAGSFTLVRDIDDESGLFQDMYGCTWIGICEGDESWVFQRCSLGEVDEAVRSGSSMWSLIHSGESAIRVEVVGDLMVSEEYDR